MATLDTARETAHTIVEEARRPVEQLREVAQELGISTKEAEAYVRKLQYRREYNMRPNVVAYRKVKQQQRLERERQIRNRINETNKTDVLRQLVETLGKEV